MTGALEGSTKSVFEKPGIEPATPGLQGIALIHYTTAASKNFCGFSMGSNQYWAGRVYGLCVNFMTGALEGSTESGSVDGRPILPIIHISTFIMSRHHLTIRLFIKFNEKSPL